MTLGSTFLKWKVSTVTADGWAIRLQELPDLRHRY
jgi:hypothetical protein